LTIGARLRSVVSFSFACSSASTRRWSASSAGSGFGAGAGCSTGAGGWTGGGSSALATVEHTSTTSPISRGAIRVSFIQDIDLTSQSVAGRVKDNQH